MLKAAGCICILAAATGMAYSLMHGYYRKIAQAQRLWELCCLMEGEISYAHCPLPELLAGLSQNQTGAYQKILQQTVQRMEQNCESSLALLWEDSCAQNKKELFLDAEEYGILQKLGEQLSASPLEASMRLLRMSERRLLSILEQKRADFAGKKKLYCCICYMAGLFSIVLLL